MMKRLVIQFTADHGEAIEDELDNFASHHTWAGAEMEEISVTSRRGSTRNFQRVASQFDDFFYNAASAKHFDQSGC